MRSVRLVLMLVGICSFFSGDCFAQGNGRQYDSLWKQVDEIAEVKGLPKSALVVVNKIYLLAKKDNREDQLIKALVYRINLNAVGKEDANVSSIKELEKEAISARGAVKAILNSIVAAAYWSYFQNNRYDLYNRTGTVNFKKEDIATWGVTDFHTHIARLYTSSIYEEALLKKTKVSTYGAIIEKGTAPNLRPTLYDLLANRALDYFKNDERNVQDPAYRFEIDKASAFDPAADFISRKFPTQDTLSLEYHALLLYQQLIAFHLYDQQPDALIDIDLKRIEFVRDLAVMENKEVLYLMTIQHLADQYQNTPAAAQAWYLLARWYADKAKEAEDAKDSIYRNGYIMAEEICEKVVAQKQESEGKYNCIDLLKEIREQEIGLITEKVNIPGQPFRALSSFRNLRKLYFRIVVWDQQYSETAPDSYEKAFREALVKKPPVKSWSQLLPDVKDHQKHSAEIKIDALPAGSYYIIASSNETFTGSKDEMTVTSISVSNIAYVENDLECMVLHRESGQPLAGATIELWQLSYNKTTRHREPVRFGITKTDTKGYVNLKNNVKGHNEVRIKINYENDRLSVLDDILYVNNSSTKHSEDMMNYERRNVRAFMFTDRSIYRPGQTVYFKGIVVTKDEGTKQSKIIPGEATRIYLENTNGEKIDSLDLVTNDYGSYSGKFNIPAQSLKGIFILRGSTFTDSYSFSVEEYKRPKFQVDYDTLKGSYKLNDSITITGHAKAYAGNNINGALVKYRVVREERFIYPWLWSKIGNSRGSNMEIAHGITTTGIDGKFSILFTAIPDKNTSKVLSPVFDYRVIADVTDNNGETRTGETFVSVSYQALQIKLALPESLEADSLRSLQVITSNTGNIFEPATVTVRMYKLQQPDRLIRNRLWDAPDLFVMSREEYIQLFPHDEYSNEREKENWPKGPAIMEQSGMSTKDGEFAVSNKVFTAGWYLVEASSVDKYGSLVMDKAYILLQDGKSNQLTNFEYITSAVKKKVIEPGEKAVITIGTAAKNITLFEQIERNEESDTSLSSGILRLLQLSNEVKTFEYPVTEKDRGGMGVHYFFVKDNRVYTVENSIAIPWTNKELSISYETYRDKTLPGSTEKWKLKISGSKKDQVTAEILAGMYDESLDQFKSHTWELPDAWKNLYSLNKWSGENNFKQSASIELFKDETDDFSYTKSYDLLNIELNLFLNRRYLSRGRASLQAMEMAKFTPPKIVADESISYEASGRNNIESDATFNVGEAFVAEKPKNNPPIQVRTNFNETAFFLPDLHTDTAGNIEFSFTMPEALTRWKFQALAHTKELKFGYTTTTLTTRKDLMVQPNVPRFMREGDRMLLSAQVVNLSAKELTGTIELQLLDAATMKPVDGLFQNINAHQFFTVDAGSSAATKFTIEVPYQYNSALLYRFIAKANADSAGNSFSDGEEASLPVLTNSMLVTESMPLPVRGYGEKKFSFTKLLQSGKSETLKQHALTVEFTSNPAWNAVQSLPYLMEYPYDCAEQTFNRFYANALASMLVGSSPKLKAIVEQWRTNDTAALLSNLTKNEELKAVLLEETPWVLEAKTESQQKKNIALLFDMIRMEKELNAALDKLIRFQSDNGSFVWFKGGPDDRYMTQYILTGIGHLKKLNAIPAAAKGKIDGIIQRALPYLDERITDDYNALIKQKANLKSNQLSYTATQFLYMRSFFPGNGIPGTALKAVSFYRSQSQQFWLQQGRYMQGMTALHLFRTGDKQTAAAILKSLKEHATISEEMGMYWIDNVRGYYWHQAPVEKQSLLIEAFGEIGGDRKIAADLKTWLLKQKQTQSWSSTKATADACYALLLNGGSDIYGANNTVIIELDDEKLMTEPDQAEAGTGYFKTRIDGANIRPAMGNITVQLSPSPLSSSIQPPLAAWGAVYWQYFETLENITLSATPLKLEKKLFIERASDRGPVLEPVLDGQVIKVGDKIKVRIELRVDRDMEYVHMKDMRASCMEPVNVLSEYKWQGGLGYYESTRDASTDFFISWLGKGTYVFEYPLFATMAGNFSNGVTSVQCMYAPEFNSHSEGVRVRVE